MARGLKVTDWVETKDKFKRGFIINNQGNGFWGIQFVTPVKHTDIARSNDLDKIDFELNENQKASRDKLFKDLAVDTKDWEWLSALTGNVSP